MSPTDWGALIDEIQQASGRLVERMMSDAVASFLEERLGHELDQAARRIVTAAPEVRFEAGLTDTEIARAEETFDFRFPPDLRAFLQTALPRGEQFPNWRDGDEQSLRERLERPVAGISFDVEKSGFWLQEWGPRPDALEEALERTRELVASAPALIPIFAHRYIPDEPEAEGNPVFSILQTDIIYYGYDLEDYLRAEFYLEGRRPWPEMVRKIRFWDVERIHNGIWTEYNPEFWNP